MKQCKVCGLLKPLTDFRLRNRSTDVRRNECRPCHSAQNLANDHQHPGRKAANARLNYQKNPAISITRSKLWEERNKERVLTSRRAADRVRYARKTGRLIKASACEECGTTEARLTASHHDYALPLDIRWLCGSCHRRFDQFDPKTLKGK